MTNSSDWVYFPNSIKLDPVHGPPIKDLGGEGWVLLSALISFPGMFLCPLLGFAILSKKKLQSTANMLIVIMSMTDWANSLLGFMMFGATYVMGHFPRQAWACHLMGFLYPTLAMTTFYILGLLTYERFCVLVKNKPINKKKAYLSVQVVFVLLGIYSALPWITNNAVGRDELKAHGGACFVGGGEGVIEQDWMILFNVVLFMITAAVMIYFYARIYLHIKAIFGKTAARVAPADEQSPGSPPSPGGRRDSTTKKKKKEASKETKILYQFIVITAFFLGCWCVLAVVWLVGSLFGVIVYNPHVDGWVGFTCHLNSSCNPLIYGAMNKNLRNAMFDMFPEGLKHILYSKTYGSEVKASIMKTTSQHLTDDVDDHEKSDKSGSSNASDASD
ncbi:hypothetical protein TL16_g03772 [Triparma laevis f. inornata]|uniref:G-protein coupled receptors family 1 profile domain-containing protein n=2 Tax=Triparma laevis TaxID=1534972 RepID=A0A9W7AAI4_9STRA|nr:hypothetical protein TL16_g03772 [Triparma laevis f. inornata]GMH64824.1 hypothetical protein TrLO_g4869 [Triparma laevis f. longispina]